MPETVRGLWRQRLRWAMGAIQVLHRDFRAMTQWKSRRMWPIYCECLISVIWGHAIAAIFLLALAGLFFTLPERFAVQGVLPGWTGVLIGVTCLFQSLVALCLDRNYDRNLARIFYWMIWYPLVYWLINMITTVCAVPAVVFRRRTARAVWVSPDRGLS
jgi:poly-beta-1,6-N-acetyl-D-glucosamine synthase